MTDTAEFASLTEGFRSELLAYCYRMLGSIHDAEDVVQETYVRAWRGFGRFEGRSSVRRWLYAIATRVCLTALDGDGRRPLPSGLGAPAEDHRVALGVGEPSVRWLEPLPDAMLDARDPAVIAASRSGVRLAFVAALQHLSARHRAILVLRDVLAFSTRETADVLGVTPDAVDAALRRARAAMTTAGATANDVAEPRDGRIRELVARYVAAFEAADADALVGLVRADVEFEMPPIPTWFSGRDAVLGFLAARVLRRPGQWHAVPTRANGQPAVAFRAVGTDGRRTDYGVQVLTVTGGRIARIVAFNDPRFVALCEVPATDARHRTDC